MKATFSIISGFVPVMKTSCKRNIDLKKHKIKKILGNINYIQMRRKIIDDYKL